MTTLSPVTFYGNEVLVDDFDYTITSDAQPVPGDADRPRVVTKVAAAVASLVAGAVLVFGPVGLSGITSDDLLVRQVIVRVHNTSVPDEVPVSDEHRQAAARFKQLFKAVPLSDVEKGTDPDYGL